MRSYQYHQKVPVDHQDWEAIYSDRSGYHWVGISDKDTDGVWKNIYTGENAYVNWRAHEPNGGTGEVTLYSKKIL